MLRDSPLAHRLLARVGMQPAYAGYENDPAILNYLAYEHAGVEIEQDGLAIIRFGEFLVERKTIDRRQLYFALVDADLRGGRLGEALVRLGFADETTVEALAAEYENLAAVDL
jgi:hypothetical protein